MECERVYDGFGGFWVRDDGFRDGVEFWLLWVLGGVGKWELLGLFGICSLWFGCFVLVVFCFCLLLCCCCGCILRLLGRSSGREGG